MAALMLAGRLEELCSIGVPLQFLLQFHGDSVMAVAPHMQALLGPANAGDTLAAAALRLSGFIPALSVRPGVHVAAREAPTGGGPEP